jgi:hypothetical protein
MTEGVPRPRIRSADHAGPGGHRVTRLEQLTEHRAIDLQQLHGMGRALGFLRQALADRGLSLDDE